jgi:hypothetical protein
VVVGQDISLFIYDESRAKTVLSKFLGRVFAEETLEQFVPKKITKGAFGAEGTPETPFRMFDYFGGSDIDHRGLHLLCQIGKGIGTFRLNPAFLFFPFEQLQVPEVFMDADENQPKANGHEDAKPFTLKTY